MRTGHERAHGPYKHGNKWRVVFVGANGSSETQSFASLAEANATIAEFRKQADARTLGEAVRDYVDQFRGAPSTKTHQRHRLVAMLQLEAGDRLLSALTPAVARKLVSDRKPQVAFETLRGEFGYSRRFAEWCVKQGWMRANPFAGIELEAPQEGRSRGKPQLRVNEVRQFLGYALADESRESTAVLLALLTGMRAHEIVERVARDFDDDCRLVIITKSKTKAGERTLAVPVALQNRVRALISGLAPDDRVFKMTRHALHYHTVKMVKAAGVPRVTPHGLRGTFATMVVTASLPGVTGPYGAPDLNGPLTVSATARMMGHNDDGDTARRHYMAPGAEQSAGVRRVEGWLVTDTETALPGVKNEPFN